MLNGLRALFVVAKFDARHRLEAIEFGRPSDRHDAVTYNGLDVFTTPAADLVTQLRRHTTIVEETEEDCHSFIAPDLLLSFWWFIESPDDEEGRFFECVLLARPGYYYQPDERHEPR